MLTAFGESKIHPLDTVVIPCQHQGRQWNARFYVTDRAATAILGQNACQKLGLIKRIDSREHTKLTREKVLEEYADVFIGLGMYQQVYDIRLDPDVTPSVQPSRHVPYAKHQQLKDILDQLEKQGVIAKVQTPTDWVSNLVITEKKNGRMRICLDPKMLNKAIKRERYLMPTLKDVQTHLNGKNIFTLIDMKDGYWRQTHRESIILLHIEHPVGQDAFPSHALWHSVSIRSHAKEEH